jgi:uncharacterized repeat protein (TIGR01451 family)
MKIRCVQGGLIILLSLLSVTAQAQLNADLAVTKIDTPDPVHTGSNLTYYVEVTNNGPGSVSNVTITDNFDPLTSVVSTTFFPPGPSCGAPVGTTLTCNVGTLVQGATSELTLVVSTNGVASGTVLSNSASVSALSNVDQVTGNNSATATTDVIDVETTPTLSQWGLLLLAGMLAVVVVLRMR